MVAPSSCASAQSLPERVRRVPDDFSENRSQRPRRPFLRQRGVQEFRLEWKIFHRFSRTRCRVERPRIPRFETPSENIAAGVRQ
jgi:hypothetical protein